MKRALPTILDTAHMLALAVWFGGLLTVGTVFLPIVLRAGLSSAQSALIVSELLQRLVGWSEVCGLVMIGVQFLLRRRYQRDRALFIGDGVRQLLTFAALLLVEMGKYSLLPAMQAARLEERRSELTALRSAFVPLAQGQILVLVIIAALTVWLQQSPRPSGAAPTEAPATASPKSAPAARKSAK